jgi:acetyl esterase/lipase
MSNRERAISITALILVAGAVLIFSAACLTVPESEIFRRLIEESEAKPPSSGTVQLDITYKARLFSLKKLDIYEPLIQYTRGKAPLVVFFIGGSWLHGDKVTLRILDRFMDRMRSEGYFIAGVNYRASIIRGFRGPVKNGIASIHWLRKHAQDYGFDPNKIALYGISAGGHIALTTEEGLRQEDCISMVFAESAPSDLIALSRGEAFKASKTLARFPKKMLQRFSPVYKVNEEMAPALIYHGDADLIVHVDQSLRLAEAINKAGGHVELEIYPDGTHAFLGMPDSLWYEQETRALLFMGKYLK